MCISCVPYLPFLRFQNSNYRVGSIYGGQVNGALLVITYGGIVEATATGLSPNDALIHLGEMADYVEGFETTGDDSGGYCLDALRR